MVIPEKLIPILDEMLYELYENRLTCALVQNDKPELSEEGRHCRAAVTRNVKWYRDFCAKYPSTRIRNKTAFDTKIKRAYIIQVLERMIKNKRSKSYYAPDFLEVAQDRYEMYERMEKAEMIPWSDQF